MRVNAARVLIGDEIVEKTAIDIENGTIVRLSPLATSEESWLADLILVPGFVDTHCHGAAGAEFVSADLAAVQAAIDYHRKHGSTTLFASTVTTEFDKLLDQISRLSQLVSADILDGIHIEGPFIAEAKKGAHDPLLLRDPTPDLVSAMLVAGNKTLKQVTIAPELPSGLQAIKVFAQHGVKAAFGHSDADDVLTKQAIDAGASVATHLFNGMRDIKHRDPGPVPILLQSSEVLIELICDGIHLHPQVADLAIRAAGIDRVTLITDAMSATGQPDGQYYLSGLKVQVVDGVARLMTEQGLGSIAGSTTNMGAAFEFVVSKLGYSIKDASKMASTNAARYYDLTRVGSINIGKEANICAVTESGELTGVMYRGKWVKKP